MIVSNLGKRLQKEIKASPQKAAILAVLGVVALYFWAPLLAGWIPRSEPTGTAVASDANAGSRPIPENVSTNEGPKVATPTWQRVDAWITEDQLMKPARKVLALRSPFEMRGGVSQTGGWVIAKVESSYQATKQALGMISGKLFFDVSEDTLDPAEAGLVLSSTISGGKRPVALINGRAYARGSTVRGVGDHVDTAFRLVEVRSKSIVLARGTLRYEVKISPTEFALNGAESAADRADASESGG